MDTETRQHIKRAIEVAREQKTYAKDRLRDLDRGERIFRGPASGEMEDVTDKHRIHLESTVDRMERIITAYEALDA